MATEGELVEALAAARDAEGRVLLEAVLDPRDCSRNLWAWGAAAAAFNG